MAPGHLPFMRRLRVLVSVGPTREYLDPVRYFTNASSGSMGRAVAEAFYRNRCRISVVSGPTHLSDFPPVRLFSVQSAVQMSRRVRTLLPAADVFVSTAAVSDYRFARPRKTKMKKSAKRIRLQLIRNPDILADAGRWKKISKRKRPLLVGFALETGNVSFEAAKKLRMKNLDLVIGNRPDSLSSRSIRPYWLEKGKRGRWLSSQSKQNLAAAIAAWALKQHGR